MWSILMNVKWRRKRRRCSCIIEWSESIPSDHHHLILNVRLSWRYFWQVLISCGIYNTQLLARWLDMLQYTYRLCVMCEGCIYYVQQVTVLGIGWFELKRWYILFGKWEVLLQRRGSEFTYVFSFLLSWYWCDFIEQKFEQEIIHMY